MNNARLRITIVPVLFILGLSSWCPGREANPFFAPGKEVFSSQRIFSNERFPNVVVATDGTVIAVWGGAHIRVRRSEDGGNNWGPEITVARYPDGVHNGGGTIVDEQTGDILVFVEDRYISDPIAKVYRSKDHGKTWVLQDTVIHPDKNGQVPAMHMNERGITLRHGRHAGRLIRPSRTFAGSNSPSNYSKHYTNAIYSDDRGRTWHTSAPFPAVGTGEATLEELSDGRIYYNSRRHFSNDGLDPRRRHIAWSYDGGETWKDLSVSAELPDGDQNRDYGLMGGLVRLPLAQPDILLFSNIDSPAGRTHGTVWASFNGGKTWPVKRLVDEKIFAYSSLTAGRAGTPSEGMIYLLYESSGGGIIARFNLAWVTGGRDWKEF
jgi:sialidase-1